MGHMYLKIIVGTAESSLNTGARCRIEVTSNCSRRTVVTDFMQCLRFWGRQVSPGRETVSRIKKMLLLIV